MTTIRHIVDRLVIIPDNLVRRRNTATSTRHNSLPPDDVVSEPYEIPRDNTGHCTEPKQQYRLHHCTGPSFSHELTGRMIQ